MKKEAPHGNVAPGIIAAHPLVITHSTLTHLLTQLPLTHLLTHSVQVAGLDDNLTREMLFSLRQSDDLRNVCEGTFYLLQKSIDLVNHAMTLIFEERQYWRHVLDADPFEKIQVSLLHAGPMGFISSLRKLIFTAQFYSKESTIDLKLAILRETFNKLASILGTLYQSGSVLKKISSDIENMAFTVIDFVDDNSSQDESDRDSITNSGVATKDRAFSTFVNRSRRRIMWALQNLVGAYENLEDFSDISSLDRESIRESQPLSRLSPADLLVHASTKFSLLEV